MAVSVSVAVAAGHDDGRVLMRRLASALLLAACLAGCGGASESAGPPAAPVKLTTTQQDEFTASLKSFANAGASFLGDLNGCGSGNSACIRSTFDSFNAEASRTDRTIADLADGVRGDCAARLTAAAVEVRDATGVIRDIADAGSRGDQAELTSLTGSATKFLDPITTAVKAQRAACG